MLYQLIGIIILTAFYGCYYIKMISQSKTLFLEKNIWCTRKKSVDIWEGDKIRHGIFIKKWEHSYYTRTSH